MRLTDKRRSLALALLVSGCSNLPGTRFSEAGGFPPSFVNQVWRVSESSGVAPGTLYVFLEEGTLVIASSYGKPAFGTWKYEGGALTMIEEGIPYKVDVLNLGEDEFKIKVNNPGEPTDITLVPAN